MTTRPIFDIIDITMSRATTTVGRQSFGKALIMANFDTTLNRVTTVSKSGYASTLAALGMNSSSAAHAAFSDHFAQDPSPNTAYLGRQQSTRQDITVSAYDAATSYFIDVINAAGTTPYGPVLAAGSAGATATALAALVDAHADVTAVAAGVDVQITLGASKEIYTAGRATGGTGTISATPTAGTTEDLDDALTECKAVSSAWYGICCAGATGRTLAQQKLVATWAESNDRLYLVASADANIRDLTAAADTSTSIAGYCKAQAMKNTAIIFHGSAATEYLDAAWLGRCLPKDPGSVNWWYKTLSSVTVDTTHTPTRRTNMGDKGCSWYEEVAGNNCTQGGYAKAQNGYGDFIDVTHLAHALKYRIPENCIGLFLANDQVPYNAQGAAMIEAQIEEAFREYSKGIESYTISIPDIDDISTSTKATRVLPDVDFRVVVKGSINGAEIQGKVSA